MSEHQTKVSRLISCWPSVRPLTALVWGRSGWSFFAEPRAVFRCRCAGSTIESDWVDPASGRPLPPPVPFTHQPLVDLERMLAWAPPASDPGGFAGRWVAMFAYELGQFIEPRARAPAGQAALNNRHCTLLEMHYCPDGFILDHATGRVTWVGDPARRVDLAPHGIASAQAARFESQSGEQAYAAAAWRVLEHIRAGDVYQVNLAHRLSAAFSGHPRAAFAILQAQARPWYGAYMERPPDEQQRGGAVLSLSPELFLEIQPGPDGVRITTRPMKGTRPAGASPRELRDHPKDRAELTMIVDLMRNDLGRICRAGSVHVPEPRTIERHGPRDGGVLQATATVSGTLREGVGMADILRATFPPGSVTGAPKIRAMQIIDELEPVPRGPYCGSIGWIGFDGRASLNVAIRTAVVEQAGAITRRREQPCGDTSDADPVQPRTCGAVMPTVESPPAAASDSPQVNVPRRSDAGLPSAPPNVPRSVATLHYSVGAGIVADSLPEAEWQETLDKAGLLRALASAGEPEAAEPPEAIHAAAAGGD